MERYVGVCINQSPGHVNRNLSRYFKQKEFNTGNWLYDEMAERQGEEGSEGEMGIGRGRKRSRERER